MLVDLIQTTTRDGVRLDGIYQPGSGPRHQTLEDAFVCVHGTGGNFYTSTLFDAVAERLLTLGSAVLRVNTRGHDLMCNTQTTRGGGRRLGAAYEAVDDCRHDLAAWIDWLLQKSGGAGGAARRRIGLIGHSLGAVKCLYAQAFEPHPAVSRVVALSPPRLSHSYFCRSENARDFLTTFEQAQQLVSAGEPGHLLEVRLPLPFVVTAAGYVEKYGPDERYNYLNLIGQIGCPVLLTLGEIEASNNMAFRDAASDVAEVAPGVKVETIAGADHFYTGAREPLIAALERWLLGGGGGGGVS